MPEVSDHDPIILDIKDVVTTREYSDGRQETIENVYEGDTFKLVCCDCGLVHRIGVIRDKFTGGIRVFMERDERSTAQHRRHLHCALHRGIGKWKLVRR